MVQFNRLRSADPGVPVADRRWSLMSPMPDEVERTTRCKGAPASSKRRARPWTPPRRRSGKKEAQ